MFRLNTYKIKEVIQMQHTLHIMQETSIEAYFHPINQPKFGKQAMTIFRLLKVYTKGFTRNEISVLLNIRISSVCGRVKELLDAEWIIELKKERVDQYSNMRNNVLRLKRTHTP